jgi:hypothetical protein
MYQAAYQDPRFTQALPDGAWTLVTDDIKAPQLLYRDEGGNEALVPSIWYNQPVSWRVRSFRYYAEQNRSCAKRWLTSKDPWAPRQADDLNKQADRLEALAAEMETTGRFPD